MASSPSSRTAAPRAVSTEEVVADAEWLAHRYDPDHEVFHFLRVTRDAHQRAAFLTDECLPDGLEPLVVRRADAMAEEPPPGPIHFIFHSAYCCSTLLARAFDRPGWAMGLKEPVVLNDIVGWRRRGGRGPDMASVLADALALLARPFAPGETVVAKPSTAVNALAPAMLTLRPEARALLLHAPLPVYLASIAKKGLEGRLWVRTLLTGMMDDGIAPKVFGPRDYLGQTDLQVAAIGWLGQHLLFADLVRRFGADRVRTLDSATLMADPSAAFAAIAALFGLELNAMGLAEIVKGPAFSRHSKLDAAFTASDRADEYRTAAAIHADEIEKVLVWTEQVAATLGVSLTAPAPLLGG